MNKITKKIAKQLVFIFLLINLALTLQMSVASAEKVYYGPLDELTKIGGQSNLPDFISTGQHPDALNDYAQPGIGAATSPIFFALDLFRYAISGIALIIVIIQAIKLVSTANEEEAGKAKSTILIGIIGLLVIQLADVAVKKMFFGEQGEAFQDVTNAKIYAGATVEQLRGIIGFVEAFVGICAVLVIVIRGFTLITSEGSEEDMGKVKSHIIYALIGVVTIILSEVIVRGVIFPEAGEKLPDIEKGKFIIVAIVNYIAGFISIIAFLGLFYGGYRYVISGGDEEFNTKFKKLIVGSIIALVIALGAFAIVNTLLKFQPAESVTNTANTQAETPAAAAPAEGT